MRHARGPHDAPACPGGASTELATAGNLTARVARGLGYTALFGVLAVMVAVSRSAGRRFDHFEAFDQANWDRVRKSRQAPLWGDFVRI